MKSLRLLPLLLLTLAAPAAHAHDHIEVGLDPLDADSLALAGVTYQVALHVPRGEPFSGYLPQFPGDAYADELTFSAEGDVLEFAAGALPRIQVLAVAGPPGGEFAFWEVGATQATWTRPAGWISPGVEDRPSWAVYEDNTGYGHLHGRAFTVNRPGNYTVVFRAIDERGALQPSQEWTVTFNALLTPPLTLAVQDGEARLTFASRPGLTYDLQVSTTLAAGSWQTIATVDGTGEELALTDDLAGRARVFYRLVEYR